eukprot:5792586-Prymnesium_polylepis.1
MSSGPALVLRTASGGRALTRSSWASKSTMSSSSLAARWRRRDTRRSSLPRPALASFSVGWQRKAARMTWHLTSN